MAGPLSHNPLLDLSPVLPRPPAGQNLARLRAEGIQGVRPGSGGHPPAARPPPAAAYGRTGPARERPGAAATSQGAGARLRVPRAPAAAPGGGPQLAGVPVADLIPGTRAASATCAALPHRAERGAGQHLDLALL